MHLKNFLLPTLLAVPAWSFAATEEFPYVDMKVCEPRPYSGIKTYWDQTRTFCFEKGGKTYRYLMTDMGEIRLRDNDHWMVNEYVRSLSDRNREEVNGYKTYYIRYLAADASADGVTPFVTQVLFNWGPGTQTLFVFGEMTTDKIRLTGYSNGTEMEGDMRAAFNVVANLLSAFNGRNPQRVGLDQTKNEDRRRSEPVVDVIETYRQKKIQAVIDFRIP